MQIDTMIPSAADLQQGLRLLYAERSLAQLVGLSAEPGYMTELLDDIAAQESALVGVAVTEIAVLHAELGGPLLGSARRRLSAGVGAAVVVFGTGRPHAYTLVDADRRW